MLTELSNRDKTLSKLRCSIASPDVIRSWSFGEVKNPETINYRQSKPETGGLFCAKIFGPTQDYECLCGRYKRIIHKGVKCEKCGVEVTLSRVRRERMGHIELASPVAHIWFLKAAPSRIAMALGMGQKDVERVVYFESYVVIDPGKSKHQKYDVLTDEQYDEAVELDNEYFQAGIGAEAIEILLKKLNIEETIVELEAAISNKPSELVQRKLSKRLKMLRTSRQSNIKLEWMIMSVLPILPPDLRPLVVIEGGHFTSSDLNDLYRRVINRNNRLTKLREQEAPEVIVRNEMRMLQEAVDALMDNGRRGTLVMGSNRRKLKSLSEMVRGKSGRFRQNLLGKRVDYSGRSVIVVGANLKLHQCGLPKQMALELFKPFVLGQLEQRGFAHTPREARQMIERKEPEVWNILNNIIYQYPVLLNRAPTLHRLGIQAFEPVLIEGKAIQVHPLVCTAFNADFDGDQMAVHVPLTYEAQTEARVLMMSSNNILSPATGSSIIVPSKDIVAGCYYLTRSRDYTKGEGMSFSSPDEVDLAFSNGLVELHTKVKVLIENKDGENGITSQVYDTTVGRALMSRILPGKVPFSLINGTLKKNDLENLVDEVFKRAGLKETVIFADQLMYMGFEYGTRSGMSFALTHLKVPSTKQKIIEKATKQVILKEEQQRGGIVTASEANNQIIDIWSNANDEVGEDMMDNLRIEKRKLANGKTIEEESFNPIYMYADSGARGSSTQIRQLAGMRGLMSRPDGSIINRPITANFREGQTVMEYFNSTHGARKGLADTALKTANSGYLTRRLVDVAHDQVVRMDDCGTENGITLTSVIEGGKIIEELHKRLYGRVLAEQVASLEPGTLIDNSNTHILKEANLTAVKVRSVVTCKSILGVCAQCYGMDLGRGQKVRKGEAIGVIAAQSIGEPGTQLTMRTFHIAGAASREVIDDNVTVDHDGTVSFVNINQQSLVEKPDGVLVNLSRRAQVRVTEKSSGRICESHNIPFGAEMLVKDGNSVKAGQTIVKWHPHTTPMIAEKGGNVVYENIVRDVTVFITEEASTGRDIVLVIPAVDRPTEAEKLRPLLNIVDKDNKVIASYQLEDGARLEVENGEAIEQGGTLSVTPLASVKNRDITGGLPRVTELFEARVPKDKALLSPISGTVTIADPVRRKLKVIVTSQDGEQAEIMVPVERRIIVRNGEIVEKGDFIADGVESQQDILEYKGVEALIRYVVQEIQNVYRSQGVAINDKHIEVIVSQMIRNVEVVDSGDTSLDFSDIVSTYRLNKENGLATTQGKRPAIHRRILQGITKAALHTDSFISAASFQETTKVLTEAAITGAEDELLALKENVILGRLVPCGTGLEKHSSQNVILEEVNRQEMAEAALALRNLEASGEALSEEAISTPTSEDGNSPAEVTTQASAEVTTQATTEVETQARKHQPK